MSKKNVRKAKAAKAVQCKGTKAQRDEGTKEAAGNKNRMLGGSASPVPQGDDKYAGAHKHWSACPDCGASKLSPPAIDSPVCMQTLQRVEDGRTGWGIMKKMRCRECGRQWIAVQPD